MGGDQQGAAFSAELLSKNSWIISFSGADCRRRRRVHRAASPQPLGPGPGRERHACLLDHRRVRPIWRSRKGQRSNPLQALAHSPVVAWPGMRSRFHTAIAAPSSPRCHITGEVSNPRSPSGARRRRAWLRRAWPAAAPALMSDAAFGGVHKTHSTPLNSVDCQRPFMPTSPQRLVA